MVPTVSRPVAMTAATTWMASQYECSAGISCVDLTYKTVVARPNASSTGVTTNAPSHRTSCPRQSRNRNTATATADPAVRNSYMLPHGTRPAESPRVTSPAMCSTNASTVSDSPIRPYLPSRSRSSGTPPPAGGAPDELGQGSCAVVGGARTATVEASADRVPCGGTPASPATDPGAADACARTLRAARPRLPNAHSAANITMASA